MTTTPLTVDFPLTGEWFVGADGTEPGHELAFDFLRLDKRLKATDQSLWRELLTAVPYQHHLGWGQPILSPFKGRVALAVDGVPEVPRAYLLKVLSVLRSALSPAERRRLERLLADPNTDIREFAGNHLVIESLEHAGVYAFLAHARQGSLLVQPGDMVEALQPVAQVGDSGQSNAPHLHFHLMSSPNPLDQHVLPFRFSAYEVLVDGSWTLKKDALPTRRQRVRSVTQVCPNA
ncbi:M23 family metallopeptidase [Pelomonas sp. CA6]|uniref:M23 family metallopeptidase n=1 Tax=Pelomonas sp. CA6 TaxID=2907999 RepID=UPI001F4BF4CA|nr:M23 family metallopeptidase [Pelomonas sp. CA6]MCH7343349.1 M23 family metallopeptidase [Pelomonas sp. CA6]